MATPKWAKNLPPSSRSQQKQQMQYSPGLSFSTGLGENGLFQKYNPTAMLNTNMGPRTVHEGEKVNIRPDGTFDVIPASQMGGQMQLAGLEAKAGIKGYAEGTLSPLIDLSGTTKTVTAEPFNLTTPYTPTVNLGAATTPTTSTQADMSGVLTRNQDTSGINSWMQNAGLATTVPTTTPTTSLPQAGGASSTNYVSDPSKTVSGVNTAIDNSTVNSITGLAGSMQNVTPATSSATAASAEGSLLGLGNKTTDTYGISNTANQIANVNTNVSTQPVADSAQKVEQAAQQTVDTTQMSGIANKLAQTTVPTQTSTMQQSASTLSGMAQKDVLSADITKTTESLDNIVSKLDSMDVNAPDRPTNEFEQQLMSAVEMLKQYASGNSYADRVASNIAMQQLDSRAAVESIKQAQAIAANNNLTEGQKNAAYAMLNRNISSQRAVLAGDLAKAASERAFNAAQQLGTLTLQASQYVEDKYKTDIAKANTAVELALSKAKTMSDIELSGLDATGKLALQQAAQQADAAKAAADVEARINDINAQAAQIGMQGLIAAGDLSSKEASLKIQEVGQRINAMVAAGQLNVEQAKLLQENIATKINALTAAGQLQATDKELALKSLESAAQIGISQATLQQQASRITLDAMIAAGELDLGLVAAEQAQQRLTLDKMIQSGELQLKADDLERLYKQQNLDSMTQQIDLAIKAGDWTLASSLVKSVNQLTGGTASGLNTTTLQRQMNQVLSQADLEITNLKNSISADQMTAITSAINSGTDLSTINKQFGTNISQTAFDSIKQNGIIGDKNYERQLNMVTTLLATPGDNNKTMAAQMLMKLYPGTAIDFTELMMSENATQATDAMASMSELMSAGVDWNNVPDATKKEWQNAIGAGADLSTLYASMKKNVVDEQWSVVESSEVYQNLLKTDPQQAQLIKGVFEASTFNTQGFTMVETVSVLNADGKTVTKFGTQAAANAYIQKNPGSSISGSTYDVAFVDPTTGNIIRPDSSISGGASGGVVTADTISAGTWKEGGIVSFDGSAYKVENGKAVPFTIGTDFDYFSADADAIIAMGVGSPYYDRVLSNRAASYINGDEILSVGSLQSIDPMYARIASQTTNKLNSTRFAGDENVAGLVSGSLMNIDGRVVRFDTFAKNNDEDGVVSFDFTDIATGNTYSFQASRSSLPGINPIGTTKALWVKDVTRYNDNGTEGSSYFGPSDDFRTLSGESAPVNLYTSGSVTTNDVSNNTSGTMYYGGGGSGYGYSTTTQQWNPYAGTGEPPDGYKNGSGQQWSAATKSWVPITASTTPPPTGAGGIGGTTTVVPAAEPITTQPVTSPTITTPTTPTPKTPLQQYQSGEINWDTYNLLAVQQSIKPPPSGQQYIVDTTMSTSGAYPGDIVNGALFDGKQWLKGSYVNGSFVPSYQPISGPTQTQVVQQNQNAGWDGKSQVTQAQWNAMTYGERNGVPLEYLENVSVSL